jgi:tRNA pseudouridine32 synthase/23S rRNA pseudouridine746 synthase
MLHPISCPSCFDREGFTNPFRYVPHPLVRSAAAQVLERLETWKHMPESSLERAIEHSFAEGKMLGVLVCRKMEHNGSDNGDIRPEGNDRCVSAEDSSTLCYLAAFSGTVRGADGRVTASVDGFVPPIIDLTSPEGHFKLKEAEISQINQRISELSSSSNLSNLKESYQRILAQQESEISAMQEKLRLSKIRREEIRKSNPDTATEDELIKESQFQKAQLKRLKDKWKEALAETGAQISAFETEISALKKERAERSDELQKWIFENALIHNAIGEVSSIWEVFNADGLIPPGGTGDCAAPKLLEYAYRNRLQPLAMGEFWYGLSPETAVRTHGHFYPSCTSKCGPLLSYMMQGLSIQNNNPTALGDPLIIHEDEAVIVVEKPSGMPSVPGLDGRKSLLEWLAERATDQSHIASDHSINSAPLKFQVHSVHRLDMDTSGVMVYAKTEAAALHLRKQFEEHTIRKTYIARLDTKHDQPIEGQTGTIQLPLSPDYDERPRQKVDFKQGKPAHTDYKILQTNPDGTTDIQLYPLTGRTHQLRVHCAHTLGLARPIAGDLLYGAYTANCFQEMPWECQWQHQCGDISRLCLHALSITFIHPLTGTPQTFTSATQSFTSATQSLTTGTQPLTTDCLPS